MFASDFGPSIGLHTALHDMQGFDEAAMPNVQIAEEKDAHKQHYLMLCEFQHQHGLKWRVFI